MIPAAAMTVAIAPHGAGARPLLITLSLRYEMQCGWPGAGSLVVRFPAGMALPARLPARPVIVNGKSAGASISSSAARSVAVSLPARPQIMCDAIGPGTLTVTFTRAAGIGAPRSAGSYLLRATHGADRFTGRFAVTP